MQDLNTPLLSGDVLMPHGMPVSTVGLRRARDSVTGEVAGGFQMDWGATGNIWTRERGLGPLQLWPADMGEGEDEDEQEGGRAGGGSSGMNSRSRSGPMTLVDSIRSP